MARKVKKAPKPESEVEQFGFLQYWVRSRSRPSLKHLVDLANDDPADPYLCSCEDTFFNKARPCYHVVRAAEFLIGCSIEEFLTKNKGKTTQQIK